MIQQGTGLWRSVPAEIRAAYRSCVADASVVWLLRQLPLVGIADGVRSGFAAL